MFEFGFCFGRCLRTASREAPLARKQKQFRVTAAADLLSLLFEKPTLGSFRECRRRRRRQRKWMRSYEPIDYSPPTRRCSATLPVSSLAPPADGIARARLVEWKRRRRRRRRRRESKPNSKRERTVAQRFEEPRLAA